METHRETPEIIIEVAPDFVEAIEHKLKKITISEGFSGDYTVKGNAACQVGDCKMSWKDGGAQRRASHLSEEILKQLEDTLADKPLLHNNGTIEKENAGETRNPETEDSPPPADQEMEHKE